MGPRWPQQSVPDLFPDGTLLEVWGEPGTADGQFNFMEAASASTVRAIAFDAAGNFYVVDTGNYRIQKFGPDRRFLTAWGEKGKEDGQFYGVTDIAVDRQGRVYVVDAGRGDSRKKHPPSRSSTLTAASWRHGATTDPSQGN